MMSEISREFAAVSEAAHVESRRPIRVGWVAGKETFTQIGRILQPLAVGLMDELVGTTIFLPEGCDRNELPNMPIGMVSYNRLQWRVFRSKTLSVLGEEIQNAQLNLLHALDSGVAALTAQLAGATGLPYVVSCHSLGDSRALGTLDERCQAVLAASEPIRRELVGARVAAPNKILLVHPGVYQVNHATCYTDDKKSIAIVAGGAMDDFDAYHALLRAFSEVRTRNYDCVFFLIGNGKAEARIREAAKEMDLRSPLTFVDRQEARQLQGILKSADIYISPRSTQQVDLVSLLAMAAGDPVLAAKSAVDDFLIDGKTALTFNAGNAAELTAKLVSILEDRQAGTVLADNALEYLREHHGAAQMVAAVAGIYRRAVEAPRPEPSATR
jgi:glycosyltransferase involved in cell wall biosynthesis